jgi:hypothetical protein
MRELFLFGLMALFTLSCERTDPNPGIDDPDLSSTAGYFPHTIGSFWIYQHVDIDPMGTEKVRAETDSVIISKDTLINGKLYYVFEGSNYPFNGGKWGIIDILRDSLGYVVNQHGEVKLSYSNFTDTLHVKTEIHQDEILYTLSYRMEKQNLRYRVPAGDFDVINFKGTVVSEREMGGIPNPRYLNTLYAEGVGNVLKTYFYFSSPNISEKRLLRYTIQP